MKSTVAGLLNLQKSTGAGVELESIKSHQSTKLSTTLWFSDTSSPSMHPTRITEPLLWTGEMPR